ncbi:unnamed protein product, partial [Ixodes hexagonus]
ASLLCTIGARLTDEAIYPIRQKLCDYIIYTHVKAIAEENKEEDASAFELFVKVADDNQESSAVQFGVSLCPDFVSAHDEYLTSFDDTMRKLHDDSGIDVFGILGFVTEGLEFPPALRSWLYGMYRGSSVIGSSRKKLFLGLRLDELYPSLRRNTARGAEVARKLQANLGDLRVDLFVLQSHVLPESQHRSKPCITNPTCSLTMIGDKEATVPDLVQCVRRSSGSYRSVIGVLRRGSADKLPGDVHLERARQHGGRLRQPYGDALVLQREQVSCLRQQ